MRVLCLTDSLESGGAQRQLCVLACLLQQQGFTVHVMSYFDLDFYGHILDEQGVERSVVRWSNRLTRILSIRRAIRQWGPDAVVAFQETPSLMAEMAAIGARPFFLIVSERNTTVRVGATVYGRWLMHLIADRVVVNSHAEGRIVWRHAPFLRSKLATITNAVDLGTFIPSAEPPSTYCRMLVVARFEKVKNPARFVEAIRIVREKQPNVRFSVDWYGNRFYRAGRPTRRSGVFVEAAERIRRYGLDHIVALHDPVKNVVPLYQKCSVFCLPSVKEGCANVIGEAMACGKPILAADVGDTSVMVQDNVNGYLFDPYDPQSIAHAIEKFIQLPDSDRSTMGSNSRRRAEAILSPDRLMEKYLNVLSRGAYPANECQA